MAALLFDPKVCPQAAFNASRRGDLLHLVFPSGAIRALVKAGEIALFLWMLIAFSFALVVATGFFG